jgi:hypothetical protein
VTEIVQSDVRQTSFPQEWLEVLLYQVLFVDRITMGRGEDQISESGVAPRCLRLGSQN